MKPRTSALLFALLLAGRALALAAPPPPPTSPPFDPDRARPLWRYVGVMPPDVDGRCPEPDPKDGWATADLFPDATDKELRRYCLYEHAGVPTAAPHVAGLRLDPDAMALAPMGGALRDALWPSLRDHFLAQAGNASLPQMAGAPLVRLAVIDTAATQETGGEGHVGGTSPHGFTLLNMAKELTCATPATCRAQVASRLALSWECFDRSQQAGCRNLVDGGIVGSVAEVAQAIHGEVEAWRASGTRRLVVNLSVGWPAAFGGSEPLADQMPAPVQAALSALEFASCRGAIVLAAAGNRSWGPDGDAGPLYPAGWEERAAPTYLACVDRGAQPNSLDFPTASSGVYRPLLHAVGGVQASNRVLANSRPGGEPRLTAFADHAVVDDTTGAPTAVLSGTSVSTLLASAAAATVAYYRPGYRPDEVMDVVYWSGTDLVRTPAFCLGGAPCPVAGLHTRRASLCKAATVACDGSTTCPVLPQCTDATALDLSAVDLGPFASTARPVALRTLRASLPATDTCHFERLLHGFRSAPTDPCPHWQYYGGWPERSADPQPGSDPCPNCTEVADAAFGAGAGTGTSTFYIEIDDLFEGELTEATLKCGMETWSLGLGTLHAGDTAVVRGTTCDGSAAVSFTLDGDTSAASPVLVSKP